MYFIDFGELGAITYDSSNTDVIEDFNDDPPAFLYNLKGNSSFEQTVTSSRDNGTTFFEQVLNLTFTKLDVLTSKQLKLIAFGRPHVIVEDYNGNLFVMGLLNGADVTGGTIVTGAAMGDLSGYTLILTGQEQTPANFIEAKATVALTLSEAGVVVSGTQINPDA